MLCNQYFKCENAATVIEYVLIVAGIAMAILGVVFAFGGDLSDLFGGLSATTAGP